VVCVNFADVGCGDKSGIESGGGGAREGAGTDARFGRGCGIGNTGACWMLTAEVLIERAGGAGGEDLEAATGTSFFFR
jgi:hypothetical protein